MARVYQTKGEDARTHHFTIPITRKLHDYLVMEAHRQNRHKTAVARDILEKAMSGKAGGRNDE